MAAGAETLKRTPLYDRHVAAGARLVPFAGWEMPVQYAGIREEHVAVREGVGVFDVSHMGEVETTGTRRRGASCSACSPTTCRRSRSTARSTPCCAARTAACSTTSSPTATATGFLTVTNASNHERDLAWMRRQARGYDVKVHDRLHDFAMLAVQGPQARELVAGLADAELPKRFRTARMPLAGAPGVLVCGTGYTGEDGVELLIAPGYATDDLGRAAWRPAPRPVGLGARDTLRLEVCFHLYGNDLMEERGPIEAGLGWCCKEDTGFIGSEAVRAAREAGPAEKLVPFAMTGPGIARQGNPVAGGGEVTSGTMSPCLGIGIGMAYVPVEKRRARHPDRDRRPRQAAPGRGAGQAAVLQGALNVADASYPDDLRYHPEHDWARIEGDVATFGITWYAQDQLGEVVFVDPPEVGKTISKDEPYAEIESVKAVSDVVAPLSGEIVEVNEALGDAPEQINDDPYGDGWLVKVRLSDTSEVEELLDRETYEGSLT